MPGKLNIFNLGDLGVRLTDSPIHAPDGAFLSAQNVQVSQVMGEHAIRKRAGMAKITGSAMAGGSILAIGAIPFPAVVGPY